MIDESFHLTSIDVRRFDFGRSLRGYDPSKVEQFRDQVAEEMERLTRINQDLDTKARSFHEQLRAFRERDKAINDALVTAQQLRSEVRDQAEREAQLVLKEAQAEGERIDAGTTDADGTLAIDLRRAFSGDPPSIWQLREEVVVLAQTADDATFMLGNLGFDAWELGVEGSGNDLLSDEDAHVFTDRGLYRPGEFDQSVLRRLPDDPRQREELGPASIAVAAVMLDRVTHRNERTQVAEHPRLGGVGLPRDLRHAEILAAGEQFEDSQRHPRGAHAFLGGLFVRLRHDPSSAAGPSPASWSTT